MVKKLTRRSAKPLLLVQVQLAPPIFFYPTSHRLTIRPNCENRADLYFRRPSGERARRGGVQGEETPCSRAEAKPRRPVR